MPHDSLFPLTSIKLRAFLFRMRPEMAQSTVYLDTLPLSTIKASPGLDNLNLSRSGIVYSLLVGLSERFEAEAKAEARAK